jgi:ATP-dependent helicase/nuclease subunit A
VNELEAFIHNEDVEEEEAFVIEEGVGSIEIRTMHSSKGLEWPMVILGSTNRSFMGQQPSEDLVFDSFNDQEMVGFAVGNYKPLAYRFIKERTTLKHIAERKRLLYVGMTRPEHHLVISAAINDYGKGARLCYNCGRNNYFSLINDELELDIDALYAGSIERVGDIQCYYPGEWYGTESGLQSVEIVEPASLPALAFHESKVFRPSGAVDPLKFLQEDTFDAGSAGTVVHKIIEECWQVLDREDECITKWLDAYDVPEEWRERIVTMAKAFTHSDHFAKLKAGAEAYFEHDYTTVDGDGNRVNGSIDLFYFDEEKNGWVIVDFKTTALRGMREEEAMIHHGYDKQLDFYAVFIESVMGKGSVKSKEICWLNEIKIKKGAKR